MIRGTLTRSIYIRRSLAPSLVRFGSSSISRPTQSASTSDTGGSSESSNTTANAQSSLTATNGGSLDLPFDSTPAGSSHDWSTSFHGLSEKAFSKEQSDILLAKVEPVDVEIRPEGLLYLPEIKYRRILNKAFGPGGWGLAPRGEHNIGTKIVSREYALVCDGRLVSVARGEQEYFDPAGVATATEGCKSNALMRCCKDLGIASELWDPRFIREFKKQHCVEAFVEHVPTKKKRKLWRRKDATFEYPYKE